MDRRPVLQDLYIKRLDNSHYPWFFGAAVEVRDQGNSIVWAGNQSYWTSSLKGKMIVIVSGSLVML